MSIRLAHDPILLLHGDVTVQLRPSLRAGLLMAQKYELQELHDTILQCHLGVISHLVAIGCGDHNEAAKFLTAKLAGALYPLESLIDPLFEFIRQSFGLSNDDSGKAPTGMPVSFVDVFTELFEFATGWLQWSPADAWAATPAEIIYARKGHFAMLRAIHGSGEEEPEQQQTYTAARLKQVEDLGYDPAFDKNAFDALRQEFGEGL
jgi:hypothetical protein